jgi:hypothetical protein
MPLYSNVDTGGKLISTFIIRKIVNDRRTTSLALGGESLDRQEVAPRENIPYSPRAFVHFDCPIEFISERLDTSWQWVTRFSVGD